MAEWVKMPLGMEVGLGPDHTLIGEDPAPLTKKGHSHPNFRPMSIVAKRSPISATAELLFHELDAEAHCFGGPIPFLNPALKCQ